MENLLESDKKYNPFFIFDLPLIFNISIEGLDKKYFELQKQSHPDLKNDSEFDSSILNTSYKIIKNPINRLKFLILALGGDIEINPDQDFLEFCLDGDLNFEYEDLLKKLENNHLTINNLETIYSRIKYLKRIILK